MNFPSFGDAEGYAQLGRACADAITGPASTFDGCYHPVRPAGIALLMAVPSLVTDDPVDAAYVLLAMNVVFFSTVVACVAAALAGDRAVLAARPARTALLTAGAFAVLLPNLVAHIPVALGDLPALAAFAGALLVAARILTGAWTGRALLLRYTACGLLAALAVLLKVTYAAHALVLLAALLALDANARGSRLRCAGAFAAGLTPVGFQLLNVLAHTGHVGLYDSEYMRQNFPPRPTGIEAVFATIPGQAAYMVKAAGIGRLDIIALRLSRGLFGFEWAVYHGLPGRGPVWEVTGGERLRAWVLVLAYLAFTGGVIARGARSLRLLNATALAGALVIAVLSHTELRYYSFARSILWLTAAVMLLSAFPRRAGGSSSAPPPP